MATVRLRGGLALAAQGALSPQPGPAGTACLSPPQYAEKGQ